MRGSRGGGELYEAGWKIGARRNSVGETLEEAMADGSSEDEEERK